MNWTNAALLSAAVFGIVNIIDSHLVSKRMPSLQSFLLPLSIIYLIYFLIFLTVFPLPTDVSIWIVLIGIVSGMFRTSGAVIMLYTFTREEVSRVVPIALTYPIFVAIMAVPLLGESLRYLEWLAIIVVVAGAIMLSIRQDVSGKSIGWSKMTLLFGSSLLFALADLSGKYVLDYISFWNLFALYSLGMFIILGAISFRPRTIEQLASLERKTSILTLVTFNEILTLIAVVLALWAIQRGPVSLVATIISSRPIFVIIFALILSRIAPAFLTWQPGRGLLALRIVATAMVVVGITIIHLV